MKWYQISGFILIAIGWASRLWAKYRQLKLRREIDDFYMRQAGYKGPEL